MCIRDSFRLNIGNAEMEKYAAKLGADCAYFISADPEDGDTACYAEGCLLYTSRCV